MGDGIENIILLAVVVLIIVVLISIAFGKVKLGKQIDASATEGLSEMVGQFSDPTRQVYDGLAVTGSEVLDVIAEYSNSADCAIKVVTNSMKGNTTDGNTLVDTPNIGEYSKKIPYVAKTGTTISDITSSGITNPESYVNDRAIFKGYIRRDMNDNIVLIAFVQE